MNPNKARGTNKWPKLKNQQAVGNIRMNFAIAQHEHSYDLAGRGCWCKPRQQ